MTTSGNQKVDDQEINYAANLISVHDTKLFHK